jgi:hypothetical protein
VTAPALSRLSGVLFLLAAAAFVAAAALGGQPAFYGVAGAFTGCGIAWLVRGRAKG